MFWETRATNSWTLQIHLFTSHSLSSTWSTSTRSKPWPYAMMLRTLTSQFGALWDTSMLSPVELWIAGSLALLCFWYVVGQKNFPQIPPNTHRYLYLLQFWPMCQAFSLGPGTPTLFDVWPYSMIHSRSLEWNVWLSPQSHQPYIYHGRMQRNTNDYWCWTPGCSLNFYYNYFQ